MNMNVMMMIMIRLDRSDTKSGKGATCLGSCPSLIT